MPISSSGHSGESRNPERIDIGVGDVAENAVIPGKPESRSGRRGTQESRALADAHLAGRHYSGFVTAAISP